MKAIIITGSTRGFGYELAVAFLRLGHKVTISGRDPDHIQKTLCALAPYRDHVVGVSCNVEYRQDIVRLWNKSIERWGTVDIWINNAGVNQQGDGLVDLFAQDVDRVLHTNLRGAIFGTQIALQGMLAQGYGQIYNVEGFGSAGMQRRGLNLYGTTKRAITYYTTACSKEAKGSPVCIGLLSPGMMVTDFLKGSHGQIRNGEQTKRIFNILGDRPDTVARFMVPKILRNGLNGRRIVWLTKRKILWRFVTSRLKTRDLFTT